MLVFAVGIAGTAVLAWTYAKPISRVVVTNVIAHENLGDLLGNLSHENVFAVLNNHNLDNGKKIAYSLLVPHMIERYGFYEGKGTPYRVEPRTVFQVLDFLKQKGKP